MAAFVKPRWMNLSIVPDRDATHHRPDPALKCRATFVTFLCNKHRIVILAFRIFTGLGILWLSNANRQIGWRRFL
jgi:hypothetical protein